MQAQKIYEIKNPPLMIYKINKQFSKEIKSDKVKPIRPN